MKTRFDWKHLRSHMVAVCTFAILAGPGCLFVVAQEEEKGEEGQAAQTNELDDNELEAKAEEEAEKDPFEIPAEADVPELFKYMDGLTQIRPKSRAEANELAKKIFPTIIKASDIVLEKAEEDEQKQEAVSRKFSAYQILVRYDPSAKENAMELAKEYADSDNDEIAATAIAYLLNDRAGTLRSASEEEAVALSDELVAFVERFGATRTTYGPASSIARSLGYSDYPEVGAKLYESLAPLFEKSEDERMAEMAKSMYGSARRMRLMGNTMEVFGTTAGGDEFAWDDYKGKVVLVDFWASWCGPCIGELPNMKKNLGLYGDKGFTIVGINMDSTREAMEKCVEEKEISWVNIVSEEEGKTGWQAPMATHYGITGIPTAILVDQSGKVVSLRARGGELDRMLGELLGPVEEEEAEESEEDSESPKAAELDSDN